MAVIETPVERIRRSAQQALDEDDRYDFRGIGVEVSGDLVTLTGSVQNAAQKKYAEDDVRSVSGVRAVTNEIMITGGVDRLVREDRDIAVSLRSALSHSENVDDSDIRIELDDAVATLAGSVGSALQRETAAQLCYSAAPDAVIVNRLAVVPTADAEDRRIAREVLGTVAEVRDLDLDLVTVESAQGVVTLTGRVGSWNVLFAAENAARTVSGVKGVRNELIIGVY